MKRLARRKKRAYQKAKLSKCKKDWTRYKNLKKLCQANCRKTYNEFVNDMIANKSKKFWTFVKSKRNDNTGVAPLKKNGIIYSDSKTKAEVLNQQFASVFTDDGDRKLPDKGNSTYPSLPNIQVRVDGVVKLLRNLNPHKAGGPDNIRPKFLREVAEELAPALTLLFQASLDQGQIPSDWKEGLVTPIFKKGERSKASNYRPISLTSICCKVLEHIVHSNVMTHLDKFAILSDAQHGFRKRRSCESQLVTTIQDLAKGLDDKQQLDAVLLDFSKAFDKVSHKRLILKLHHYGIRGQVLQWIEAFLSDRTQRVVIDGQMSTPAKVTSGVPQGTVLGPLLFLVFINDLPAAVSSTTRMFADDCLMYRSISSIDDTKQLQEDLDNLQQWESDWLMSFNPDKCEVMSITNKKMPIHASYSIHGHQLKSTNCAKYLGVNISSNLSWSQHINQTVKKANSSLSFLRRNIGHCPQQIKSQAYTTYVRPILEYASCAWAPYTMYDINRLEAIQNRAARFTMSDYSRFSSVSSMKSQLNWDLLQSRRQKAKATMMYKIHHHLIDIQAPTLLIPLVTITRGHNLRYQQIRCRLDLYKYSFFPSSVQLWNGLPVAVAEATSLDAFKHGLSSVSLM